MFEGLLLISVILIVFSQLLPEKESQPKTGRASLRLRKSATNQKQLINCMPVRPRRNHKRVQPRQRNTDGAAI